MAKIGIDLGTTNTVVFIPKKGIVVNEPSVVAISVLDNKIISVGASAKEMIGRTPDSIVISKPLVDGAIADYRVTGAMLRYFIKKAAGFMSFVKPEVLISVPAGITSTEKRAVIEAALNAGAKAVYLVKEPVLAAIGAKIPINSPAGNMILNIGGGTTELAVISLGGIVTWSSVRIGGNKLDQAIVEYIKKKHGLAIEVGSNEITEALSEQLREIVQIVKNVLEVTPPELCSDIMDKGIIISGGGALLKNIDVLINRITGVPASIADDPLFCVARGTGIVLQNLDAYKRNVVAKR
ncbi:MAG: Cell shape determining protein, MreB/Mrl family [Candidatus Yanofskybacteria bacterium GW2011_GWA2_44_9]|uniref:Cell shape-determining protein MreB n=1 Tax=Candidatus Yanofskybacteria bacterium GW2011_GWA2_44_9 TaxID=1619025 RepID=A0A0G1KFX1_9BACT|nr:MAG: Cell shape determining protein, MreB/Mrl family [Candidatus Yanofskybacteria bacterium GW2011_GWA2_44_9]